MQHLLHEKREERCPHYSMIKTVVSAEYNTHIAETLPGLHLQFYNYAYIQWGQYAKVTVVCWTRWWHTVLWACFRAKVQWYTGAIIISVFNKFEPFYKEIINWYSLLEKRRKKKKNAIQLNVQHQGADLSATDTHVLQSRLTWLSPTTHH